MVLLQLMCLLTTHEISGGARKELTSRKERIKRPLCLVRIYIHAIKRAYMDKRSENAECSSRHIAALKMADMQHKLSLIFTSAVRRRVRFGSYMTTQTAGFYICNKKLLCCSAPAPEEGVVWLDDSVIVVVCVPRSVIAIYIQLYHGRLFGVARGRVIDRHGRLIVAPHRSSRQAIDVELMDFDSDIATSLAVQLRQLHD